MPQKHLWSKQFNCCSIWFGPKVPPFLLLCSALYSLNSSFRRMDPIAPKISSSCSTNLVLHSSSQSSCSWRVRFALNQKGLSYEYRSASLTKEFERLNPLKMVPVLEDGDFVVSDSFAILLYLEEKYPQNALLPVDNLGKKALNLQVASIVSCSIQPLHMLGVLKEIQEKFGVEQQLLWAQAQYSIEKGFNALEILLKDVCCRYATGDEVSLADIFLAPQISIAITRFKIDMNKFPTLSRIYEEYKVLPAFQASLPEVQPDALSH